MISCQTYATFEGGSVGRNCRGTAAKGCQNISIFLDLCEYNPGSGQCLAVGNTATEKLQIGTTCSCLGRRALMVVPRSVLHFLKCPKPARESRLSKLTFSCLWVFRRRRRTRPIQSVPYSQLEEKSLMRANLRRKP